LGGGSSAAIGARLFGFDDRFRHLLGVAQQHHSVVVIDQRIADAGVTGAEGSIV
jgi:hypothetical protein